MDTWKGIVGKSFAPDEFDAYVKALSFEAWKPQFVVVHNTFDPTLSKWHDVPGLSRMRGLENYYRSPQPQGQGWSAGPHVFVADDLIWAFTPLTVSGVHSPSWNAVSWGVETVGDYNTEIVSPAIQTNLTAALTTLHQAIGLDPATIRFHHEDPLTTHKGCPGTNLVKNDVIKWVQDRMGVC